MAEKLLPTRFKPIKPVMLNNKSNPKVFKPQEVALMGDFVCRSVRMSSKFFENFEKEFL